MNNYFWDNKDKICPNCGGVLTPFKSVLTEDLQQQTVSCNNKNCGKIFYITYKLILDTFTECKEY
ncbi:hypothetical protein [Clostridium botulinum]|uniref:hypothetical protein n=1 Tax=Clostridium botulinum TaxID=1491 RepID=UPI00174E395E|nr:hypothetical protein [Clostridium botulinum]MBD5589346.1 hypothetical protein [Clostridium botulinum]